MGAGIGKMFGMDRLFGGLLDSIGLGALKPLVNIAFDFATGNLPGILQDLTSLMSTFGSGAFGNNVATRQPLPDAFNAENDFEDTSYRTENSERSENAVRNCGCREDDGDLSSNRIGELFRLLGEIFTSKDPANTMSKLSELFKLLSENAENRQTIADARTNVQFYSGGFTVNA